MGCFDVSGVAGALAVKHNAYIFISVWLYVIMAGLTLQWIILPLTPLHAGDGLMQGGDWTSFHKMGVELAYSIKEQGWSVWEPRYKMQAPASIAAALYVVTGVEAPWVLLPLYGFIWGIAALAIYSMAQAIGMKHRLALFTVAMLLLFPSTAMVWGQIHKDIFSITGALLLMHYWIWWLQVAKGQKALNAMSFLMRLLVLIMAIAMVVYVRPYLGKVAMLSSLAAFATGVMLLVAQRLPRNHAILANMSRSLLVGLCGLVMLWTIVDWNNRQNNLINLNNQTTSIDLNEKTLSAQRTFKCQDWQPTDWIPYALDNTLSALACARDGFRNGIKGGSSLDVHIGFKSAKAVLSYMPRALQISLFSPFPDSWLKEGVQEGGTIMRLLIIPEIIVLYISFVGVVLALCQPRLRQPALVILAFSLTWALVNALTVTNIGTLYRMRYPSMIIWIVLGAAGWVNWLKGFKKYGD